MVSTSLRLLFFLRDGHPLRSCCLCFFFCLSLRHFSGPGVTNTITAVKNAQMAQSPVILLGGAAATLLKGRGALQDIDQMALFKPLCKFCATVSRVVDIVPTLRKAFQE